MSRATRRLVWVLMSVASLSLQGCLQNNIPYPRIQPDFLTMEADGLVKPAEIDAANRMVTLTFGEEVNIKAAQITSYTITEGASFTSGNLSAPIDLSEYYICTLSLYQNYDWVIKGVQTIERYFTVENQVGATIIDVGGRRVKVNVSSNGGGLKNVKVLTMKLGPVNSIVTPALEGETIDLTRPVDVTVRAYGEECVWTIIGEEVTSNVQTVRADAWTNVAWVYGAGLDGVDNGVEYRQYGSQEWIKAPSAWVTNTGSTFYARLVSLNPETEYEARTYGGDEYGDVVRFTTGSIVQVPNSSLSDWSKNGAVWQPWGEGQTPYWDTGNKGAATLGQSNVVPTSDTSSGTGQAAMLQTKFVGVGIIGKIAAGSVFIGSYLRTDGTNGVLQFGREFTERPTKLRGYFNYKTAPINKASAEYQHLMGQPDTCVVWCALIDSPEPFECRTNPKDQNLFDPSASYVVAYGRMQCGQDVPQYIPFEVELQYTATNRRPTYLVVVASSSKYGDYFTGGDGAVMCVDDLELLYDY
ncbi:MAG: PCMD domain-containing protein [Muribaculaceae bacterium]|uniref:PCMD domain-containing protein n=2 Tax=Duncaniella TaxID=2518495 RepID=UPI000AA3DB15